MSRPIFAAVAAFFAAATLSHTAQACISCEYVPEVVRKHATSSEAYGRGQVVYSPHKSYSERAARKRVANTPGAGKPIKAAKAEKPVQLEPTKVTKVLRPDQDNSAPLKTAAAKGDAHAVTPAESESSSITVASVDDVKLAPVDAKVSGTPAKPTDCKKFFPSVGMTLTVPCE